MLGGFLGAGKTTAVSQLAGHLKAQGLRVGMITNDQGSRLVDTAMLQSRGFAVEEIAGGCFCCRFNSLMEAADKLSRSSRPDAFIAEPVGSCTDLVATVTYPLRRIYGDEFVVAPLSVLVDPIRALRLFGLSDGSQFSDKVRYIYRKQLEEADLILINKCDLISAEQAARLRAALENEFPHSEVLVISARTGAGLGPWFDKLASAQQVERQVMDVDYDRYADGEALLGWLNATVALTGVPSFHANQALQQLAAELESRLTSHHAEIAHLKMTLDPAGGLGDLAVINVVRNDTIAELSQELEDPLITAGQLILNLRAETDPETLHRTVVESLAALTSATRGLRAEVEHIEFFRPGRPQPTHRVKH